MISLVGDIIFSVDAEMEGTTTVVCNYCDSSAKTNKRYDYCYLCACILCTDCRGRYQLVDQRVLFFSVESQQEPEISSFQQLIQLCREEGPQIIVFWLAGSSPSDMLRDVIAYHQGKLRIQPGKTVPAIVWVQQSSQSEELAQRYGVTEFPTAILVGSQGQAIRTVIGMSWYQIAVLNRFQEMMLNGQEGITAQFCASDDCGEPLAIANRQDGLCLTCYNATPGSFMPGESRGQGMYCENGHYRCINCCWAAVPPPTIYRDFTGLSYLTSSFSSLVLPPCPKGHQCILKKDQMPEKWDYNCFSCKQQRWYDNQYGVGECECGNRICAGCLGLKLPTFEELIQGKQLVSHTLASTGEEVSLCFCGRHFKKTYCSLPLSLQEFSLPLENRKQWSCFLCRKQGKSGQLHLACYACRVFAETRGEENCNFQICFNCARKSSLIQLSPSKTVEEKKSHFDCPKDGRRLVRTSFSYNKQLTVSCHFCQRIYFGNSNRYYCKSCGTNCCLRCEQSLLNTSAVPLCQQVSLSRLSGVQKDILWNISSSRKKKWSSVVVVWLH